MYPSWFLTILIMWSEEDQQQKCIAKSKGQAQVKCQRTGYENTTTNTSKTEKKQKDNEIKYILKRSIIQKTHEDHIYIRVAINRQKAY